LFTHGKPFGMGTVGGEQQGESNKFLHGGFGFG
jgi:hypothetical protein